MVDIRPLCARRPSWFAAGGNAADPRNRPRDRWCQISGVVGSGLRDRELAGVDDDGQVCPSV